MLKRMLVVAVVLVAALAIAGCATNDQNGVGPGYQGSGAGGSSSGGHHGHH